VRWNPGIAVLGEVAAGGAPDVAAVSRRLEPAARLRGRDDGDGTLLLLLLLLLLLAAALTLRSAALSATATLIASRAPASAAPMPASVSSFRSAALLEVSLLSGAASPSPLSAALRESLVAGRLRHSARVAGISAGIIGASAGVAVLGLGVGGGLGIPIQVAAMRLLGRTPFALVRLVRDVFAVRVRLTHVVYLVTCCCSPVGRGCAGSGWSAPSSVP